MPAITPVQVNMNSRSSDALSAGFLSGDGAGFLHKTVQEQNSITERLVGDVTALREQIAQLETSMSQAVLASTQRTSCLCVTYVVCACMAHIVRA